MIIRHHKGFGHGLRPGTNSDMNCPSCRRENVECPVGTPHIVRNWRDAHACKCGRAHISWE